MAMPQQHLEAVQNDAGSIMEEVVAKGDLKALSPEQRAAYYTNVCKSMGLNPFTKPFEFITLNSKLTLYATRTAADQLRKIHGVSITGIDREIIDDLIVVTVRVADSSGRTDEEVGAVSFGGLKGEAKANAIMKAITKAKRRATLSICGLGWLDETEVETVPSARPATVNSDTGEIQDTTPPHRHASQPAPGEVANDPGQQTLYSASDEWQDANRKLHTVATHIISDDARVAHETLHVMAQLKNVDSLTKLTADDLHKMADFIESDRFGAYHDQFIAPKLQAVAATA